MNGQSSPYEDTSPIRSVFRYGIAIVAVAAAFLLRHMLSAWSGGPLPTYITFYPAVMLVALFAGLGPGLVATATAALMTDYWILPPRGLFHYTHASDAVGQALFSGMGVFMNVVAEFLKRENARRVRAEKAVQAERQRFSDVLDMLPAYVVLLSPDYHVPFANRFFRERFGESHGRRCYEYLFHRTEPCENCETFKVLKKMKPHEWEWTGPDGRNYSIFDFPFTDSDGSPLILEMGIDITEQKQAQEKVRAASLYARSLIEASLDPLVTISPDGKIMDVNEATEGVTGVPRQELIGSDFSDYFTEPEKARQGYRRVFEEGHVTDYPLAIRSRDGRVTDVLYNAVIFKNEAGEVQGVFAAARDITERKKAETRQAFTNELLQFFVKKATRKEYLDAVAGLLHQWSGCRCLGVRVVDQQQRIPYESYIGFSKEFVELENWLSLKTDQCACIRVMMGKPEPCDLQAVTPGGSFCLNNSPDFLKSLSKEQQARFRGNCIKSGFQSIAIVPIRYRDQIVGAVHFVDERPGMVPPEKVEFIETMTPLIGEAIRRFSVEAQIRRLNEELEERVEQRTAQLKTANEELESFSYSVSHDLRTPLRAIDGFSRMVAEEYSKGLDAEGQRLLATIRENTQKMGGLIDAILALSRMSSKEIDLRPIEMTELARATFDELKGVAPDRVIQFECRALPPAQGDLMLIRAVMSNLVANAIKFTGKQRQAVIEVGGRAEARENVYYVRDNGVGFDMKYAGRLFGAFQRLHSEGEFEGTGVGLATVQRIIHRHGGRVWAEGKAGEGAVLYFTLPRA